MAKYDFYRSVEPSLHLNSVQYPYIKYPSEVKVETLEDIYSLARMDEYYVLTDADGNQFIRDFKKYSKVDMWLDEYDYVDSQYHLEEESEIDNVIKLFTGKAVDER